MKKILYIVLDGLGDLPCKELKNRTPLEAAVTPNLDKLSQKGVTGMVQPVGQGIAPESDIAVLSLLGYDYIKFYTGRGPLEALASGARIADGNLAVRVNFASLEDDGRTIKDRRAARGLSKEEADILAKEINTKITLSNATFNFYHTVGHRGVLVIQGMHFRLSGKITNTDPAYERKEMFSVPSVDPSNLILESKPLPGCEELQEAAGSAAIINEFSAKAFKVLSESPVNKKRITENKLPANGLLFRDAGDSIMQLPQINEVYGLSFGTFVEMPVEKGIALLAGMKIVEVPSSTGHLDVDYPVWAKVAADAVKGYDCLYIHVKGPDECGHEGDCKRKKEVIEVIDKYFFGSLLSQINLDDFILAVTSDHATVCAYKSHSADPVPLLVSGGSITPDGTMSFSGKSASLGSLGKLTGQEVLPLLIKYSRQ